ncbi:MAG: GNAT family N-acetyltransferase [Kiritimatiellae bacterium]|nr:GNAT family N-acetyltransferase [Kiritimatiellia bacterium]
MKKLGETVQTLVLEIGPRPPGSRAEHQAARYLLDRLRGLGIEASIEPFPSASHIATHAHIVLCRSGKPFDSLPCQFSPLAETEGPLLFFGDFDTALCGNRIPGAVALIMGGKDHAGRRKLLLELERQGCAAVIFVSPVVDAIQTKVLRYPEITRMPIVATSMRTGATLCRHLGERVRVTVRGESSPRNESQNIVVRIPGSGPHWMAVSSHYDSAPFSPGAVDNAGGTALLLELAHRLAAEKPRASIELLFTGSEEYGEDDLTARGALAYYKSRLHRLETCLGHLDTDGLGHRLGVAQVYLCGPRPFRHTILTAGIDRLYLPRRKSGGGCDHGAAERHGVPFAWFTDITDLNRAPLHTPDDTLAFLDLERLAAHLEPILEVIKRLSNASPPFPFAREGDLLVRPARSSDIPSILEITRAAFGPYSLARIREDFFGQKLGGREWYEHKNRSVADFCRQHILETVVAESAGHVVGYATYHFEEDSEVAVIGNNAVHPDFQGRGIGSRLQREIDRRMREEGYTQFYVATLGNDLPAQRVYEKLGYQRVAETYHYLRKLED